MAEPSPAKKPSVEAMASPPMEARPAAWTGTNNSRRLDMQSVPLVTPSRRSQYFYERQCYDQFYELVIKLLKTGERCVTVVGTPGIGLSTFYAYFAMRYRKTHEDVRVIAMASSALGIADVAMWQGTSYGLSSSQENDLAKFVRRTVKEIRGYTPLLLLCDGPPPIRQGYGQAVVITSPDPEWLQSVERLDCTYYMPLWTRKELHEAARVLVLPLDEAVIDERFRVFGGTPRYCLHTDPSMVEAATELMNRSIGGISGLSELRELLTGTKTSITRFRLVHCEPQGGDATRSTTRFATLFVEEKLAAQLRSLDISERDKICEWLRTIPWAVGLLNRIVEGTAHGPRPGGE